VSPNAIRAERSERCIEVVGRITALAIGTCALELIMQGIAAWLQVNWGINRCHLAKSEVFR